MPCPSVWTVFLIGLITTATGWLVENRRKHVRLIATLSGFQNVLDIAWPC